MGARGRWELGCLVPVSGRGALRCLRCVRWSWRRWRRLRGGFWVLGAGCWGWGRSPSPPYRVRGRLSPTTGEGEDVEGAEGCEDARERSDWDVSSPLGEGSGAGLKPAPTGGRSAGEEPPLCISPPAGERFGLGSVFSGGGEIGGRVGEAGELVELLEVLADVV